MKAHLQRKHYVGCAKFLLFSGIALLPTEVLASDSAILQPPVRLETIDGIVDTGDALGHSGPCMEDVDGDGMRELTEFHSLLVEVRP